ncbi:MAG TPA: serine/threonine-protein kinase [Rhodanobacteraceae bacterium]|nr:serine/threonine-protein kinase [Rhodanobacteraceae bacterium]
MSETPRIAPAAIEAAFDQAARLDGAQREAWLRELGSRQPRLAAELRAWLAEDTDNTGFDTAPAALAGDMTEQRMALATGTRLGAWRILATLGAGGMGRVYRAERADGAFDKEVAIKVLRRERRLPDSLLHHERQLLARLEHPAIPRLLDGGIGASGELYLVMELVHGASLGHWCRAQRPGLAQRLAVFAQLLDAVAYAHRALVVHGDIKPDNVLVDAHGRARLLDFGIARLLAEAHADGDVAAAGLTPAWAAPECRHGAIPDVRSDVYALGALLHFLLHGNAPASPPAANSTPLAIPRSARRDLDAILARALTDDPQQRYPDVASLRNDLEHQQRHQPVAARNGGRWYRARRFLRRHWLATGSATVLALVLLASTAIVVGQNRIVRAERDRAQLEVARSQTVLDYLIGVLGNAQGGAAGQSAPSLRSLLSDSLTHINSDFAGDLTARQLLLSRLAELHVHMADFTTADTLLDWFQQGEQGHSSPLVRARVLDNRALVALHQGQLDVAAESASKALDLLRPLAQETRGRRSQILVTQARIQQRQGQADSALATLRRALALRLAVSPADAGQSVVVRNSLAVALMHGGNYPAALTQFGQLEQALASSHREHSKDAADIYNNYASTSFAWGLHAQAERLFGRALRLQEGLYGPSASLAALLNNYGKLKLARGELDAGADLIDRAMAMMARYAGADSIDAQLIGLSRGAVAASRGEFARASGIYADAIAQLTSVLGDAHPLLTRIRAQALGAAAHDGSVSVDDARFDTLLTSLAAAPSGTRPRANLLCQRAQLALTQRQLQAARRSAAQCLALWTHAQAAMSPRLALAQFLRDEAEFRAQAVSASERDASWRKLTRALGPTHPRLARLARLRDG